MIDKNKLAGASLVALAIALTGSAALADRGDRMGEGGMGPMQAFDFAAVDADKDGKITPAELDAYRAAEAKAVDADGDGFLSAAELAAMHVKAATQRANDMAARMIERLDSDKDGKLSAAEMAVRPAPTRIFDRLDTDNDGAISEAELAAAKERMAERGEDGPRGKHRRGGHDHN